MIDCTIIGGGIAGLVAASELAASGCSVRLLEARPRLGGRTFSYIDGRGDELDNGQHIMMGCYASARAFLKRIGSINLVQEVPRMNIPFRHLDGRTGVLRAGRLPHPLSIMYAFFRYRLLSISERLRVLMFARKLQSLDSHALDELDTVPVSEWLQDSNQSTAAIEALWRPMVLATMNAEIRDASAKLFAVVLREMFLKDASAHSVMLPSAGLSRLFAEPAEAYLTGCGAEIRTRCMVESIRPMEGGFAIREGIGHEMTSSTVILAAPVWNAVQLLRRSSLDRAVALDVQAFHPSEILSIHVWSRAGISSHPMTGLLGTTVQWVFEKGRSASGAFLASCTISAASELRDSAPDDIHAVVLKELTRVFPHLSPGDILDTKVIKERKATFIPLPGLEKHRPSNVTSLPGFFLAGDWTDTGFPATIESAARSGERAATAARGFLLS